MYRSQTRQEHSLKKTQTDEIILQDTALNYRVLNFVGFPGNTFNENNTSYWHKSVGGYHAAKLRRYQEMIDHHITPEMKDAYQEVAGAGGAMDSVDASKFRVLNMLNTKYFIFLPDSKDRRFLLKTLMRMVTLGLWIRCSMSIMQMKRLMR